MNMIRGCRVDSLKKLVSSSTQIPKTRSIHGSLLTRDFASPSSASFLNDVKSRQNKLFDDEKKRQSSLIPRLEKIKVTVEGIKSTGGKNIVLLMNKGISTPYDCALHIHELYSKEPIALVDNSTLWDFHRPLESDCTLSFQNFLQDDPRQVNRVFWKSCSFILGLVVETAFKSDQEVSLHSWPNHSPGSGSFIYDVHLPKLQSWSPTRNELLAMTSVMWKLKDKAMQFERLTLPMDVAQEMFSNNQFKLKQLNGMARERVTVYRLGDHIDISVGPMISNSNQVGRCAVTAVHSVKSTDGVPLFRFQGLALPDTLRMNQFAYNLLVDKSKELNPAPCI